MKQLVIFLVKSLLTLLPIIVLGQQNIDPKEIKEKCNGLQMPSWVFLYMQEFMLLMVLMNPGVFTIKKISYADYMKQLKGFTLKNYDPAFWADLIQESGARYAVITTKHHDGVAMYDTKMNNLSIVKANTCKERYDQNIL